MIPVRGYRAPWWTLALDVARMVLATLVRPSARTLWSWLSRPRRVRADGVDHVPRDGAYVLAINHFSDGASGAVVLAALEAASTVDPTVIDRVLLVAGGRERPTQSKAAQIARRIGRAIAAFTRRRWSEHLVVLSMEGTRPDWGALRSWQRVASERVSVVYPEGIARVTLGPMRPGVAKWLASLAVATVPCAVWFDDGVWNVRFGRPLSWSKNRRALDAQLGLAVAALLPEALRGDWAHDLARLERVKSSAPAVSAR